VQYIRCFIIALCFVLFAIGCYSPVCPPHVELNFHGKTVVDVDVYVADGFTDSEVLNIIEGVRLWERSLGGAMQWHLFSYDSFQKDKICDCHSLEGAEHRVVMFRRAVSTDKWVVDWQTEQKKTLLGLCNDDGLNKATVWLIEDKLTTQLSERIVTAHEFGHALGLSHVSDMTSVMSQYQSYKIKCITQHDVKEFCDIHDCDASLVGPTLSCTE
jgi:hypothetical protein